MFYFKLMIKKNKIVFKNYYKCNFFNFSLYTNYDSLINPDIYDSYNNYDFFMFFDNNYNSYESSTNQNDY